MRSLLFLPLFLLATAVQAQVINDANVAVRELPPFHAIEVSGGVDLYVSQGDQAVAVSARDEASRDEIRTEVRNGVLHISPGAHVGGRAAKAYVACAKIDGLSASGGCDIYLNGRLQADSITIRISGGSDISGEVEAGVLAIAQNGGSDADLKGHVGRLTISATAGSDFNGYDLASDDCSISASGGSDITITVNRAFWADANGASDINWKGGATVRKASASGAGSISHRS